MSDDIRDLIADSLARADKERREAKAKRDARYKIHFLVCNHTITVNPGDMLYDVYRNNIPLSKPYGLTVRVYSCCPQCKTESGKLFACLMLGAMSGYLPDKGEGDAKE